MKKLSWTTVQKTVKELLPQDINPRAITKSQMNKLKNSLEKFNLVEIPAIDLDNRILAGHQRITALKILGREDEVIDVRVPNRKLTEKESKEYLIASNALGGDWNLELLQLFDCEMLLDIGFDEAILNDVWDLDINTKEEEGSEDKDVLENSKKPKTKRGDIITRGNHRLICGDSTDPKVLSQLLKNQKASMIFSDPIYNISLDYNKGLGGKQNYGGSVIDTRSDEEYQQFLRKSMSCALEVAHNDTHVFYWNTEQHIWIIQTLYRELGLTNKRVCLWVKNGHNPTPLVAFNKCYEPCVYGTRGKPYLSKHMEYTEIMNTDIASGNKGLDDINLWTSKRLSGSDYQHATSKPPEVYEKALRRCTQVNDIVLDSFGGSGSLLIACEQLKRRAYIVELEPKFCDVIVDRYEKLTGCKAHYEKIKKDN